MSHIAPLCQPLPQLAPECSGHVMALPQLCPKACGSAGCTACTGPFMWLFTFLCLLFSRQRTGSKLFMSFPLTVGNDISPWALGCLRCIAFSQPLPCFPSTNGEITIGIGESRCQAAHLPEILSQCAWLCDVMGSVRDVTLPWRRDVGLGVSPRKEPTADEPLRGGGQGSSGLSVFPPPSPPLQRQASGEPRALRGGFCSPGKREGTRPG